MSNHINRSYSILYHHRTLGDGAEGIHVREMVKAFRGLGHQVSVVGPVGETVPTQGGSPGALAKIKSLLPGALFELCEILYSAYSFLTFVWLILSRKPDFIYDRYVTFNAGCVLAAKLFAVPLFLEVNAPLALERSEQPDERLYFKKIAFLIERWVCRNAFKTIVVSTPLKEYLESTGVPSGKIIVMPNGVDPDKFVPRPKNSVLYNKIVGHKDAIVIGFTGVLRPWHGLDTLVCAVAKLAEKFNVFLLVVGGGPIHQEIEALIEKKDLVKNAYITGRIAHEDVPDYVNLFDIAVSPKATFYASPMKVVEYMALGKAVVIPDTANFLDMVDPSENGMSFDDSNLDGLYDALSQLCEDAELRTWLGHSASEKVRTRLNWRWNASEVCRLLKK